MRLALLIVVATSTGCGLFGPSLGDYTLAQDGGEADAIGVDIGTSDAGHDDAVVTDALGPDATPSDATPTDVGPSDAGPFYVRRHVTAGVAHACAIAASGNVRCWGANSSAQIGAGPPGSDVRVATTVLTGTGVSIGGATSIAAGGWSTCAVLGGGTVSCWGHNMWGQLGHGTTSEPVGHAGAVGGPVAVVHVAGGPTNHCAMATLRTHCWGANQFDQINNAVAPDPSPTPMLAQVGLQAPGTELVDLGIGHGCGTNGADVWCWGNNSSNQVGPVAPSPATAVRRTDLPAVPVRDIACGDDHCCIVAGSGDWGYVHCWGRNTDGQLSGSSAGSTQITVPGITDALGVAAGAGGMGGGFSCALRVGGRVSCWGSDANGRLGDAATHPGDISRVPVDVEFPAPHPNIIDIDCGDSFACAISDDSRVWCWGSNASGQLTLDSMIMDSAVPVRINGF